SWRCWPRTRTCATCARPTRPGATGSSAPCGGPDWRSPSAGTAVRSCSTAPCPRTCRRPPDGSARLGGGGRRGPVEGGEQPGRQTQATDEGDGEAGGTVEVEAEGVVDAPLARPDRGEGDADGGEHEVVLPPVLGDQQPVA